MLRRALGLLARESDSSLLAILSDASPRSAALRLFSALRWQHWYKDQDGEEGEAEEGGPRTTRWEGAIVCLR